MGSTTDDHSDDEKRVMQLSWRKLEKSHQTDGYREGAVAGKDLQFQDAFDEGYENGFKKSYMVGFDCGEKRILDFIQKTEEKSSITKELQNSLNTLCNVCHK